MDQKIKDFFDKAFEFVYDLWNLFEEVKDYRQFITMDMPYKELEGKSSQFYSKEEAILEKTNTEIAGKIEDEKVIKEKLRTFFMGAEDGEQKVDFCLMIATRLVTIKDSINSLIDEVKSGISYEEYIKKEEEIEKLLREAERWKDELVWRIAENRKDWYSQDIAKRSLKNGIGEGL
jgi:hypothetical protein